MIAPARLGSVLRHAWTVLTGLLSIAVCKVVAMWAIARWEGPVVQGAFSLMLACVSFGAIVLCAGLDYANAYHTGRAPERLRSILAGTGIVMTVAAALSPLWVFGYGQLFPQLLTPGGMATPGVFAIIAAATALTALIQSLQAVAVGLQDYRGIARANTLLGVVWLALALPAVRYSDYRAIVLAWALTLVAANLFYLNRLRRVDATSGVGDLRETLGRQLRYGARTVPGSVARALNLRSGLYLASVFLTPAQVGVYGLLLVIAEVLLYVPTALGQVVLGSTSARGEETRDLRRLYVLILVGGAAATVVMAFAASPLLGLVFGSQYRQGGPALAVLFAAMTMHSVGLLRIHHVLGSGRPATASAAQGVTLVVNLGVGAVLAPRFGLVGAAVASLLAYTVFATFLLATRDEVPAASAAPSVSSGTPADSDSESVRAGVHVTTASRE